jgi:hypothetical protein
MVLGHELAYFVKHEAKGKMNWEGINMLEFLSDNKYLSSSNGTIFNKS